MHQTIQRRLFLGSRHPLKIMIERLWRWKWFALFVIFPSLLSVVYYGFIASGMYVSESRFVIKSSDHKPAQIPSLASIIQSSGLSSGRDQTNEIIDYLRSRDALRDLSGRVDVRRAFMSPDADRFSRFPPIFYRDSFENLYKFYGRMVAADLDHETENAVLTVKAFDPKQARALNENLLELSESMINRLNERANAKAIAEAEGRVQAAELRVRSARMKLSQYRNGTQLLDPAQQGAGILDLTNRLIAERAELRASLAAMERAAPANPSIPSLRQRINALSSQIDAQGLRAAGSPSGLATKLSRYEELTIDQDFATQMLTAANASLEQARSDAIKQQFYLERVVQPNTPDDALLPSRIKEILAVLFGTLCLYLVGWMLVVGILEHAPEDR